MDPCKLNYYNDKFEAVWRRVMSASSEEDTQAQKISPTSYDSDSAETARLREFMDNEASGAQLYGTLAFMFPGRIRQRLLSISRDELRHLKILKAEYFIITGKAYEIHAACPSIRSGLDTLRVKAVSVKDGIHAYLKAANETKDAELADTYKKLALDETHHLKILRSIIEDII